MKIVTNVCLIVMTAAMLALAWTTVRVMIATERLLTNLNTEVEKISALTSSISDETKNLQTRIAAIESNFNAMLNSNPVRGAADFSSEAVKSLNSKPKPNSETTTAEIDYLLQRISASDFQWIADGELKPILMAYTIVRSKYLILRNEIGTADAFIEKAAATDMLGKRIVIGKSVEKPVNLDEWLRAELDKRRKQQQTP